jgi:hypothetical protein
MSMSRVDQSLGAVDGGRRTLIPGQPCGYPDGRRGDVLRNEEIPLWVNGAFGSYVHTREED